MVRLIVAPRGCFASGLPVLSGHFGYLCLIQLGPGPVLLPSIVWLAYTGESGSALILTMFTVVATTVDQFVRPAIISRGADLPILIILGGVIGGLLAFGAVGMFIGPAVLAVCYTLIDVWMRDGVCEPHEPVQSIETAP